LLALTASEAGYSVLLVDAADSLGTLHYLVGASPSRGLADLKGGAVSASELLVPVTTTLTLLPGGARDDSLTTVERRALYRRVAELYASYDLVVVDGGSRLESVMGVSAAGAERLIAVTTSDRIAVAAAYALIKAAAAKHPELHAEVLLNGCEEGMAAYGYELIQTAAEQFLERNVALSGVVPHDASLKAALGEGMMIGDAAAGSPAAIVMHEIAMRLLDELQTEHTGQPRSAESRHSQSRS
ncbi:MAG: hypothetical protein M3081_10380, partial [Gemmatimonadota bacterium]|nr:hypothetical protein [Gemmatimonadota bacterium]